MQLFRGASRFFDVGSQHSRPQNGQADARTHICGARLEAAMWRCALQTLQLTKGVCEWKLREKLEGLPLVHCLSEEIGRGWRLLKMALLGSHARPSTDPASRRLRDGGGRTVRCAARC